jgi:hypothetical protein
LRAKSRNPVMTPLSHFSGCFDSAGFAQDDFVVHFTPLIEPRGAARVV